MLVHVILIATLFATFPLAAKAHEWTARGPPRDKNGALLSPPRHTPMFSRYTPYLSEESIPGPVYGQPMLRYQGNNPPDDAGKSAPAPEAGRRSGDGSAERRPQNEVPAASAVSAPRREGGSGAERDVSAPTSAEERSVEKLSGHRELPLKAPAEERNEAETVGGSPDNPGGVSTPVYVDLGKWAASQRPFSKISRRLGDGDQNGHEAAGGQPSSDQRFVTGSTSSHPLPQLGESLQLTTKAFSAPNNAIGLPQNVAVNGTSQLHLPLSRPHPNFPLGPNVPVERGENKPPLPQLPLLPPRANVGNSTSGPPPRSSANRTRLVEHRLIDPVGPSSDTLPTTPLPHSPLSGPFHSSGRNSGGGSAGGAGDRPHRPPDSHSDGSGERRQSGSSHEHERIPPPNQGRPPNHRGIPPDHQRGPIQNPDRSDESGEHRGTPPNRGGHGHGSNRRGPPPSDRRDSGSGERQRAPFSNGDPRPFNHRGSTGPINRSGPPKISYPDGSSERSRGPKPFNRDDHRPFNRGGPAPSNRGTNRPNQPNHRQPHSESGEERSDERDEHRRGGGEDGRLGRGKGPPNFRPPVGFHDLGQLFPQFPNFPPFPIGEPPNHERHNHSGREHSSEGSRPPHRHHSHERGG